MRTPSLSKVYGGEQFALGFGGRAVGGRLGPAGTTPAVGLGSAALAVGVGAGVTTVAVAMGPGPALASDTDMAVSPDSFDAPVASADGSADAASSAGARA